MRNIVILIILISASTMINAQNYGSWTEIDSMNIARVGHAMVVLPNGNILVSGSEADSIQSSAEIYDISTGNWRYTNPMNVPRAYHNLVLLKTGKVLAIGGFRERSCELFDPVTEAWSMTDSIPTFRQSGQTVTKLIDGRILVTGGMYVDTTTWNIVFLNKADIYDLNTNKWTGANPMYLSRYAHTATLLNDGSVLIAGGSTEDFETNESEIYDPILNQWEIISNMNEKRSDHAAILLDNGNVLITGGQANLIYKKSCEIYDVNTNQWKYIADMLAYRIDHRIYYLSKIDKLLILGGDVYPPGTEDTWEIFDPASLFPLYKESFPINQFLTYNNVQLTNRNIFLAGNEEYEVPPGGLPYRWPSKKSWIFDVVTDVTEKLNNPNYFKLYQNHPNPFNPTTTISYSLQEYSHVLLKIYDVLGNEIETLVNTKQTSGKYNITFVASNLSSGIYYYRLTVDGISLSKGKRFQKTKKMVLIR